MGAPVNWLILLVIITISLFSNSAAAIEQSLQPLKYNCDLNSFPQERKVLKQKYKDLYGDRNKLVADIKEKGGQTSVEDGDFCVAKTDLNRDGIEDIFLFFGFGPLTCGTAGCQTNAYVVDKKGEWKEVLSLYSYHEGVFLAEMHDGYRVLAITQKISCPCDKITRPDGTEVIENTTDKVFVYDKKSGAYRRIGIHSE